MTVYRERAVQEPRRAGGVLNNDAFTVKCQAPRPHVGVDAEGSPSGSWMEAARPFCERIRPADAGREQRRTRDSASGIGATLDSSHAPWRLPLCDRGGVGRDGAYVNNFQVRSRTVEEDPMCGSTGSVKEHSQANSSHPEGDIVDSLCGFLRLPCRHTADGAQYSDYCDKALPKQVSTEQVGHL